MNVERRVADARAEAKLNAAKISHRRHRWEKHGKCFQHPAYVRPSIPRAQVFPTLPENSYLYTTLCTTLSYRRG